MDPLTGVEWLRLTTIPRVAGPDPRRWLAASIEAAVVASHAELVRTEPETALAPADSVAGVRGAGSLGRPLLAAAWIRPGDADAGAGAVRFLVGGRPALPLRANPAGPAVASSRANEPVLFPPGATGEPLESRTARDWFTGLPAWIRCLGTTDADDDPGPAGPPPTAAGTSDLPAGLDDYAVHLSSPFAWLMLAEPLGWDDLDEQIALVAARMTALGRRDSSPAAQVDLDRGRRQLRELTRARAAGAWKVHLLAGAGDAARARQAASLLCSAVASAAPGHLLFPGDKTGRLTQTIGDVADGPDRSASPFLAGAPVVAAIARPPMRELPGIRLLDPYRFDLTPVEPADADAIELGAVLDEALRPAGPLRISYDTLNRHGFICGATGSGKSQTARRLLESLSTGPRRIPWLVVEPAKAEYAGMAGRLASAGAGDVLVIRPGDLAAAPASLNPLEPEPGFPLQSHADLVRALFLAAFEANEPFPQVLSHALTKCYTDAGWNLVTSQLQRPLKPKDRVSDPDEPQVPRYPTLAELQATARRVVDNIGYGKEVAADVRGFVDVRIGSLRQGTPGRFFEGGHPLDIAQLMRQNVVLELDPITNDQDKAFLIGSVLIRLVEHLRVRDREGLQANGLQHVLLIEEAHRLLKNVQAGPAAAAVELFAELLAEIRAYGEGVVIVEQIPSKILSDVIKNTALKVMHRLPAQDDRETVGATMNLGPADGSASQAVVSFPPGIAAVTVDGDDRPLLMGVSGGMSRESSSDARTDPPLRGRRSALCGSACLASACTLSQLEAATMVADEPALLIWSETVAATMALGRVAPAPRPAVRTLWPADQRQQDCTLATLSGRAAAARRTLLAPWIDPADFAAHHASVVQALLAGSVLPPSDPDRWRAGAFRWQDVYVELRRALTAAGDSPAGDSAGGLAPHPGTDAWRERGLDLDAPTMAGQYEQLTNDPSYRFGTEKVVFGDVEVSGVRGALLTLAGQASVAGLERALRYVLEPDADDLAKRLAEHWPT